MAAKLRLLVCENFAREAAAIVTGVGFEDVDLLSFPANCNRPPASEVLADIGSGKPEAVRLICGPCGTIEHPQAGTIAETFAHVADKCAHLIIGMSSAATYCDRGAHLLTPGLVTHWNDYLRVSFPNGGEVLGGEQVDHLMLLDTGVHELALESLSELARHVNVPYHVVPVGLDYFRLVLTEIVLRWRLDRERERAATTAKGYASEEALAEANRRSADFAMLVDLIASLTKTMSEPETIDHIFEVFASLFAPAKLVYTPLFDGHPGESRIRPPSAATSHAITAESAESAEQIALLPSGTGFRLRINHQGETLAILEIDGVAFPEYRDHYLNLALTVSGVCGMAVSNARQYEVIRRMGELLDAEREQLAVTLQSIGDGVIAVDTEARVVLLNGVAEQLTGWRREEAIGQQLGEIFRILNARTREACDNPVERALRTGTIVELANNTALIAKDGTERIIADSAAPIRDTTGHVRGVVLVFRDVTARERAQEALRDANQALQTTARIVDNSPDLISLVDRQYAYRRVNPTYSRMFGKPISEIEGSAAWDFLGETVFQNVIRPNIDRCLSGETVRFEEWFTLPNAGPRYMEVRYYPLLGDGGEVEFAVIVSRDITEHKQAEEFREEYLHLISHDLRSPLTGISGMAQWLQRSLLKKGLEREARGMDTILTSAKRMNRMVQDLVESARLESGHLELRREPTDILGLVLDLVDRTGTMEDRKRIRIEAPEPVPPVPADPERLERAIVNLLTNALKYSPKDRPVVVEIGLGDGAVVRVVDHGAGIPADDLPRLFTRYYRAKTAGGAEGLGLGLYITRLIVEAHGGRVAVESAVDTGSKFTITLPLADPYSDRTTR